MGTNVTSRGYRYPDGNATPALDILLGQLAGDIDADLAAVANAAPINGALSAGVNIVTTPSQVREQLLGAGKWRISASGYVDYATNTVPVYEVTLRNVAATVDQVLLGVGTTGKLSWSLDGTVVLTGTTSINVYGRITNAVTGTALIYSRIKAVRIL